MRDTEAQHARGGAAADKILVIQPLPGIGDMLWNLPFIHAIASSTALGKVSLLTKRRSKADQLLACDPAIDDIIWLERDGLHAGLKGLLGLASLLRAGGFDAVWILHQSARYALAARLAAIPLRVGYGSGLQAYFLSHGQHLPRGAVPAHPIEAGRNLLQHLGFEVEARQKRLPTCADKRQAAREKWRVDAGINNVCLGIGSSEAFKMWPWERFAELAVRIHQAGPARIYLLGGGPREAELAQAIRQRAGAAGVDIVDAIDAPIDECVHLLSLMDCYVGNDTGFLNVAAALEIPCVGIFGGSAPLRYSPYIHAVVPPQGALETYDPSGEGIRSVSVDAVHDELLRSCRQ